MTQRPEDIPFQTAPNAGPLDTQTSVKSALRTLHVFEFFLLNRRHATAKEIATDLNIPQSSMSMLLRSLKDHGYLDYNERDKTYLPTPRVTLLGAWLDQGPIRDGRLIDALNWLSEETREAVVVATRIGIYSHYIYVIPATGNLRYHIPIGSRRLAATSATGQILLSHLDDEEISAIIRRTNSEIAEVQIDLKKTLETIRAARAAGYAFSRGQVTPGAGAIAVTLPHSIETAGRPLAVSIASLLPTLEQREAEFVEKLTMVREQVAGAKDVS